MLGMGILVFASMIAISQLFVTIGGPLVPDLLADMPTLFHYTDGQRTPEYLPLFTESIIYENSTRYTEQEFSDAYPSLAMYGLMVKIALGLFVILLMLAGLSYFFEEFNLVRPGTAYAIIAKMIVLIPLYFVLPYLWDTVALVIESSSLYLMDPFGGDPHARTTELWCMMGSVACVIDGATFDPINIFENVGDFDRDTALNQDSWNNALQSPIFGEDYLINVLLSLFKGFSVMFMTAMMFVLSALRVMLTEVIIISFPLVSAIGLIPWINTNRISEMFQQNLIGLSIAPIISAIVLSVGLSTIDSQNMPPLRMWFQLLSIGFLAIFFPVMLSPMLGNLSTKVGNMVSTSITSASVAGSAGVKGALQGLTQANKTGMGGAMAAGVVSANRFSSANVGASSSGRALGTMPMGEKLKMYGAAGTIGMLGGLGSGLVASSTQSMGLGSAASGVSNQISHAGDNKIGRIVTNTLVDNAAKTVTNQLAQIESLHMPSSPMRVSDGVLVNPGNSMNCMFENDASFDLGQQLLSEPAARKQFTSLYGQKMGLDSVSHEKLDTQITEQINAHPNAAGKLFSEMKNNASQGAT